MSHFIYARIWLKTSLENFNSSIINVPVLVYPDYNESFTLTTDSSDFAIGSVLSQTKIISLPTTPGL